MSVMCEYEVEWGKTSGHGVHDIQGFILSHLWAHLFAINLLECRQVEDNKGH
jgi:hypothetical protein